MSNTCHVKVKKLYPDATLPTQGSAAAAGWDVYAYLPDHEDFSARGIAPHTTVKFHTGLALELEEGWVCCIYARSGLATKSGLAPANKVGVLDSDYRGELIVALHNDLDDWGSVTHGDRIAQILFQPVPKVEWEEVEELSETDRGEGGFGSTGT